MQEKNEQIADKLKAEHPWMDVDANLKKMGFDDKYWEGFEKLYRVFEKSGLNPNRQRVFYQETSDDCSGNLFKKKI